MRDIEDLVEIIESSNGSNCNSYDADLMNSKDPDAIANVHRMRMEMNKIAILERVLEAAFSPIAIPRSAETTLD